MFACFYPGEYVDSTYGIDFGALYAQGYRGIIFDIDNTLVPHGAPADARAKALFAKLKELGFSCCLLSNNKEGRVKMFNEDIGVSYIYNAHKPSTGNYRKACEIMHTDEKTTIFIGDQLFTDVWGGNRLGLLTIWVRARSRREFLATQIVRQVERVVVRHLEKTKRMPEEGWL